MLDRLNDSVSKKVDIDHESVIGDIEDSKVAAELERHINQPNAEIYAEAIARYPNDEAIDQADEARLKRKLDKRILPLLGICYFFYVRAQLCCFSWWLKLLTVVH